MQQRFEQRTVRWAGREWQLPALPNLADLHRLTPLELEARFSNILQNRHEEFSKGAKSCLTTMFVNYMTEAEQRGLYTAPKKKRIIEEFKSSSDWPAVLQNQATGPRKGVSGTQTNATRPSEVKVWAPRAPASASLWKMPDAPTWDRPTMTFQKFVNIFNAKNNVDNSRGFEPWESVMSFFKDYVAQHFTAEAGKLGVVNHLLTALKTTKLTSIPAPVLAKHLRLLEAYKLQATEEITRKRARDDAGQQLSGAKRIKQEEGLQGAIPAGLATNAGNAPLLKALKPSPQAGPAATTTNAGVLEGSSISQNNGINGTRPATSGSAGASPRGLASNPTLGPIRVSRPTVSASPTPSAAAWLQANIPNGPEGLLKATNPPETKISTATSLPVGLDGTNNPTVSSQKANKSLVKLEVILEGVMDDIQGMITKAKEPGTTEVLTEDQQHLLNGLLYSHKGALKELKSLRDSVGS